METYTLNGEVLDASKMTVKSSFAFPKPNYSIYFHDKDNQTVGKIDFNGPTLVFEGDAEESAKVFIDWVAMAFEGRLKEEYQRGYEDCLTEEAKK